MKAQAALVVIAVFGIALTAPTTAGASERYAVSISYQDLNLDRTAGADAFIDRVERAARRTCDQRSGPMPLRQRNSINGCVDTFTQRGVLEVNHRNVTRRYIERGGSLPSVSIHS